jgi:hypothetical protein
MLCSKKFISAVFTISFATPQLTGCIVITKTITLLMLRELFNLYSEIKVKVPIPVAARCEAWVCGRSLIGIPGSNHLQLVSTLSLSNLHHYSTCMDLIVWRQEQFLLFLERLKCKGVSCSNI